MLPFLFFFFNDTATTEIYTLSLHDALPIYIAYRLTDLTPLVNYSNWLQDKLINLVKTALHADRKSTRLNSSHGYISYAVFCLKKKKKKKRRHINKCESTTSSTPTYVQCRQN